MVDLIDSAGYFGLSSCFISYHVKNKKRLPHWHCAKRLINRISIHHRNCRKQKFLLRNKYKNSMFLSDSFDMEFDRFCPRNTLVAAISNAWIGQLRNEQLDAFIDLFSSRRDRFYDYIHREMVESGLMVSRRSFDDDRQIILSWHPEVYRFLSHLTCCFWEASTSALCERYLKYCSEKTESNRFFNYANVVIKAPYVLTYKEGNKVRVTIFKRSSTNDIDSFSNIVSDAHANNVHAYFENLNNNLVDDYHRQSTQGRRLPL